MSDEYSKAMGYVSPQDEFADDDACAPGVTLIEPPPWIADATPDELRCIALVPAITGAGFDFGVCDRAGVPTSGRFIDWLGDQMWWNAPSIKAARERWKEETP